MGHVSIDRGGHQGAIMVCDKAADKISDYCPVIIFPEGTRRVKSMCGDKPKLDKVDSELILKKGCANIMLKRNCNICFFSMWGSSRAFHTNKRNCTVRFHRPLTYDQYKYLIKSDCDKSTNVQFITDYIHDTMVHNLESGLNDFLEDDYPG